MIRTLHDPLPSETLKEAVRHYTVQNSVRGYLEAMGLANRISGLSLPDPET
jgi:hypothetical protein